MPDLLRIFRAGALLAAVVAAFAAVPLAYADGEAGLVVQDGDQVKTYCIAFTGDGITGQELLKRAGISVEAFGGGSGLAVCALGERGCPDASSFSSCFCQCQGGDCTYWAFFTRQYGKSWVYSALAFNLIKAKDGDVHGWKWGRGGPNSAPAPQDITFAQICGHEPQGGAPTATVPPPTATSTLAAATSAATTTATGSSTAQPSPPEAATQPGTASPPTQAPTVTVSITRAAGVTPGNTVAPPATGSQKDDDGGSSGTYIAFGAIAAVLVAGAVFGAVRKGRRDR